MKTMNTLPYQKHSETSIDAAMQNTTAHTIRNDALKLIMLAGVFGLIADEVAAKLKQVPNLIASRIKELEDQGHIIKTKLKRKTRRDRLAFIYVHARYWTESMSKAPVKKISANEEKRCFLIAMKKHIDQYGHINITPDNAVYNEIKGMLAR